MKQRINLFLKAKYLRQELLHSRMKMEEKICSLKLFLTTVSSSLLLPMLATRIDHAAIPVKKFKRILQGVYLSVSDNLVAIEICSFDSLLISLCQIQASWHIMQLTGIRAAETACLYKGRKYSLSMSRNDPN